MAINTLDKLQYLSFIFAVLLSNSVHFIALRLGKLVQMFLRYRFSRWQNFIWRGVREDWGMSPCQILSKLVHQSWRYCNF